MEYDIVVTNAGATALNVQLTDVLHANITFRSVTIDPFDGTCDPLTVGATSGTIECDLGAVPMANPAQITLRVRPTAEVGVVRSVTNTVNVTSDNAGSDSATENTQVAPSRLAVAKEDLPDPVDVGELLQYTVAVRNGFTGDRDVNLIDELPPATQVDFLAVDSEQGSCSESNNIVVCDLGIIADGDTVEVDIFVQPLQEGIIESEAQVFREGHPFAPVDETEEPTLVQDNDGDGGSGSGGGGDDGGNDDGNNGGNNNGNNDGNSNNQYDDFFDEFFGNDGDLDQDLNEEVDEDLDETSDLFDDEEDTDDGVVAETNEDGASSEAEGTSANAGDPDEQAPVSGPRGDVVDEIDTGGFPLLRRVGARSRR